MKKRIYTIIAVLAIGMLIYFMVNPHAIASGTLLWSVSILYALFVGSLHGILGHSLSTNQKGNMIFYPLLMGMLFTGLAFIYIYLVLPLIIPGFM